MKRQLSLLTASALMLTALASCGSSEPTTTDTTAAPSPDETTAPVVESEYKKPNVDLGGKTMTFAIIDATQLAYKIGTYIMLTDEENGDLINDALVKANRAVEEELNVKLEPMLLPRATSYNVADPYTKPILAGDDEYQIALPMVAGLRVILSTPDVVRDLNEIDTLDLSHSWWDQNSVYEYNIGGKQYAVNGDLSIFMKGAPICYFFNKQLVEDLKLSNPYQMVYDGTWTFDEMAKLAEAAAADLNGNSEVDVDDRFGLFCESANMTHNLIAGGVRYSSRDKDGNISLTLNDQKTATLVEKIFNLMTNTKITVRAESSMVKGKYASVYTDFFSPVFMDNRALFYSNQTLLALDYREMESDFGLLPPPKYDEEQKDYHSLLNAAWADTVMVPVTNPDLDATGYVLDAMGYYYQQYVTTAFIDQTVLNKSVRDTDSEKMVRMIYDNVSYDVAINFNWGNCYTLVNNITNGTEANFASVYASNEAAIKAAMDKTINSMNG